MIIFLDVLVENNRTTLSEPMWKTKPIAINLTMGVRISEDKGICWISLSDNSVWKSAHDFLTTCDIYANLFSQAVDTPYRVPVNSESRVDINVTYPNSKSETHHEE